MSKYIKSIQLLCLAFAVGSFLTITLSLSAPDSSAAPPAVQNMRGVWDGFIHQDGSPPDRIRTEITAQENRRFTGIVAWGDPHVIEGTVSASGNVNYQGRSANSRIIGKMDLLDFGGGAAILDGSQTQILNDGAIADPCTRVMRSFSEPAGTVLPDAAGRYVGTLSGDGVTGQVDMRLLGPPNPSRPTSFPGTINITIAGETHTFLLLGTVNSGGRVIAITATTDGHGILDGLLSDPDIRTINGTFTLELHDGSVVEGAFQTQETRGTES